MQAMYIGCLLTYPAVTGNPLIREEMELKTQIKDLTSEKNRFNEQRYKLQDDIRIKYPQQISTLETTVEKNAHDFEKAQQGAVEYADEKGETRSDYPLTINGKSHLNRREAGQAIKDVVSRNYSRLASDKNTLSIGEYRGFKLNIFYDDLTNTMKMCMQGEKPHYIDLNISTDIGNMQRMDNAIANITKENTGLTEKISTLKSELEQMKVDVMTEFPKAAELAKLERRLNDVQDELTKFELTDDSLAKELFDRLTETFPDVMCGDRPSQNGFVGDNTDKVSVSMDGDIFTFRKSFVTNSVPTVYAFAVDYENKKVQLAGYKDSLQEQSFDIHAAPTPESVKKINAILADMDDLLDVVDERGLNIVDDEIAEPNKGINR